MLADKVTYSPPRGNSGEVLCYFGSNLPSPLLHTSITGIHIQQSDFFRKFLPIFSKQNNAPSIFKNYLSKKSIMKIIVTTRQYDLMLKLDKPHFPVQFSGKIAPIVNDILNNYTSSSEIRKT